MKDKLPFKEAIDYFRDKVNLPSDSYTDLLAEANTIGFTVAGANRLAIVEDFRKSLQKALDEGTTLKAFQDDFDAIVKRHGWSYKGRRGWRTRVIFETNLRTAQAAGRWKQIKRNVKQRPYLMYVAVQDERTRRTHKSLHGLIYRHDHEFWITHAPPNGWGCRCRVQALSERDLERKGYSVSTAMPANGIVSHSLKRSDGTTFQVKVPGGIDPGWDYNVGENRLTAITPPPTPGTIKGGSGAKASTPLPAPRKAKSSALLEKGLENEDYAQAFLDEFGIKRSGLFVDKVGEALPLSEELFKTQGGQWKITKKGREEYLRLLARNIQDPDEIWFDWVRRPDRGWRLRRRYISRFEIADQQLSGVTVFEVMRDGWREVTNFAPKNDKTATKQDEYLEKQRTGLLVYQRKK